MINATKTTYPNSTSLYSNDFISKKQKTITLHSKQGHTLIVPITTLVTEPVSPNKYTPRNPKTQYTKFVLNTSSNLSDTHKSKSIGNIRSKTDLSDRSNSQNAGTKFEKNFRINTELTNYSEKFDDPYLDKNFILKNSHTNVSLKQNQEAEYFTMSPRLKLDSVKIKSKPLLNHDISHIDNTPLQKRQFKSYSNFKIQDQFFKNLAKSKVEYVANDELEMENITLKLMKFDLGEFFKEDRMQILASYELISKLMNFKKFTSFNECKVSEIIIDNLTILHESLRLGEDYLFEKNSSKAEITIMVSTLIQEIKHVMPNVFQDLPCSRNELDLLFEYCKNKLSELKNSQSQETIQQTNYFITLCFHEILRQIILDCSSRGQILAFFWNAYFSLMITIISFLSKKAGITIIKSNHKLERIKKKMEDSELRYLQRLEEKENEVKRWSVKYDIQSQQLETFYLDQKKLRNHCNQYKKIINQYINAITILKNQLEDEKNKKKTIADDLDFEKIEQDKQIKEKDDQSSSKDSILEIDVNYDITQDIDFNNEAGSHEDMLRQFSTSIIDTQSQRQKPVSYDKYTLRDLEIEYQNKINVETQTELCLIGQDYEIVFKSKASVDNAVRDYITKNRFLNKFTDLDNLEPEITTIDVVTEEAIKNFYDNPLPVQNEPSKKLLPRQPTIKSGKLAESNDLNENKEDSNLVKSKSTDGDTNKFGKSFISNNEVVRIPVTASLGEIEKKKNKKISSIYKQIESKQYNR